MFGNFSSIEEKRKVVCSQCNQVILVLESQLPKVVECPACGWKRKIDKDISE